MRRLAAAAVLGPVATRYHGDKAVPRVHGSTQRSSGRGGGEAGDDDRRRRRADGKLRPGPAEPDRQLPGLRQVPGRPQDPAVVGLLRRDPEGQHTVPLLQGHPDRGDAHLHGQGRLRRQLLQEAPPPRLQLWK